MAKRKMVQINLIKNSIAAYFAAIEIHNKPNISYRYETVTLLMMNAWELALKAYVKKYIKNRSIFTQDGHTISADKALDYVNEHRNSIKANSFTAIKKNIEEIEKYRNNIAHFYCEQLEPYIFMLVARSALNYVDFMKTQFSKDVMVDEGLFIMPLGFKLPFKPEDFLSDKAANYAASEETKCFIQDIVTVIRSLKEAGIEDSIVLGFDIYLESVKKASNSDILAAITTIDAANATFAKVTNAKFSTDPNAQIFNMSDQEFRAIWKYTHAELLTWCKENISDFKQGIIFNKIKKQLKSDINCVYTRRLDSKNSKSASQDFYTDFALERIKEEYEKLSKA
jgi:hypothetical protein